MPEKKTASSLLHVSDSRVPGGPVLPDYIIINDEDQPQEKRAILRQPAEPVSFPLSPEDQQALKLLEAKFDQEKNMAGLAAPQIGISKRMIIFAAPDDSDLKKWRKDHEQVFPKTLWMNPEYHPLPENPSEMVTDFEACFSVKNVAGPVARYRNITYRAQRPDGVWIEGQAKGYAARIIQHEIDHLNGVLFIDKVSEKELIPMEIYRQHVRETILESKAFLDD